MFPHNKTLPAVVFGAFLPVRCCCAGCPHGGGVARAEPGSGRGEGWFTFLPRWKPRLRGVDSSGSCSRSTRGQTRVCPARQAHLDHLLDLSWTSRAEYSSLDLQEEPSDPPGLSVMFVSD